MVAVAALFILLCNIRQHLPVVAQGKEERRLFLVKFPLNFSFLDNTFTIKEAESFPDTFWLDI